MTVKSAGLAVLQRAPWLRRQVRRARTGLLARRYRRYAHGGPVDDLVVFEAFVGRSYAGSPRALYEAMLADERYAGWRFVWVLRAPEHATRFAALADPRTTVVGFGTSGYYRSFARARVWISNSILAPELTPRPDQFYLQTWHGTPLKRIGLDVVATDETALNGKAEIDERYRVEAGKVDRFLSACEFTTECFTSAFGVTPARADRLFVETGNPRNDQLATASDADRLAARERLGIATDKQVVLYAPTWRDDQFSARSGYVYEQPLDLAALREALGDEYLVLFRAHYLVTSALDLTAHAGFVRDVSDVDEINELCLASDILVTDYSSVYFDFALLDRPMVFFLYDLERYVSALRGLYLPIDELPGPIVETQDELVAALQRRDLVTDAAQARAALNARMSPHDDGAVCRRVLDLVHHELSTALRAG